MNLTHYDVQQIALNILLVTGIAVWVVMLYSQRDDL